MERPKLDTKISAEDFQSYYWLKEELVTFCKTVGLKTVGGKLEITKAITTLLKTGQKIEIITTKKVATSNFDWSNEALTLETIITDNYRNTENVREFFISAIGGQFNFNVLFMNWMKANPDKTLGAAIDQWKEIDARKKSQKGKKEIAPQFEYNTYIRDFLLDNPGLSTKEAIKFWKIKRAKPGPTKYCKDDIIR